ncbi:hypothetical protein CEN50_04720 [Fischerella thermalis CCMEE 5268]|uniref:Uncharacterized protein n=1 Tax=Fischerella thermalis CCMEE 5268 TaxID=2019662 RepID=A0A2N6KK39_9CYAN|nr:hypothetical protein CEN50_04720 [Fischerella thermalis CCMEE 5268]
MKKIRNYKKGRGQRAEGSSDEKISTAMDESVLLPYTPHPLSRQRAEGKNLFLPLPFMVLYPLLS